MGRNKKIVKVKTTIEGALDDAQDELGCLAEEMGEWRDNMQGTNLETTGRYETIEEVAGILENVQGEIESLAIPDVLHGWPVEYTHIRPYGKKRPSRYDRSAMVHAALESISNTLNIIIEAIEEHRQGVVEGSRSPDERLLEVLHADHLASLDDEALNALDDKIKDIQSPIDDTMAEIEDLEFPGFYY